MQDNGNEEYFEINLRDLYKRAKNHFLKILLFTILGAIISVFYSLTIPEKYTSQAISIKAETNRPNSDMGATSGLLNMFTPGPSSSANKTITILKSRYFFRNFYEDDKFLFELMAVKSYDIKSKKYKVDQAIYDETNSKWIAKPSFESSYKVFREEHFAVSVDQVTDEIYTSAKHVNPYVALNWNQLILSKINEISKNKFLKNSETALSYYKDLLATEQSLAVRSVLISSISSELQTIATSNSNEEFALEIIDPPYLPEKSSEPNNLIISILGTIIFFIISSAFFIYIDFRKTLFDSSQHKSI
ncbi:Wzz/FepE/Etk N-terminal domain-containing protein [Gammaproteobacteria bacterium]|nr:Wzz/FepE/Etk N-terminal domain-containing protein [Gammaproteobacteria bacterium]